MPSDVEPPQIRMATRRDRSGLELFSCSDGAWFAEEVEEYVREHALNVYLRGMLDHRLLLCLSDQTIVGVGAHEIRLFTYEQETITGTYLVVLALARGYWGSRIDRGPNKGQRLADLLLREMLRDADNAGRGTVFEGVVATENARGLAVCRRNGLTQERPDVLDSRYLVLRGIGT